MMAKSPDWYCPECGCVLGQVVGSEFTPGEKVPHRNIVTRGPNLAVTCPECGKVKIWYTSDPVTRAMYQLIDAMTTVSTKRMVEVLGAETYRLLREIEQKRQE